MSNFEQYDPLDGRQLPSPAEFLAMCAQAGPILFQSGITQLHHQMVLMELQEDLRSPIDADNEEGARYAINLMQSSTEAPLMVGNYHDDRTGATYYGLYRFAINDDRVEIMLATELQMVYRHPNDDVGVYWGNVDGEDDESYRRYYKSVFGDLQFTPEQARLIADLGDAYPVPGACPAYLWDDSEGELHR